MPSSVISSFSYNEGSSTLRIIFVSGMVYDYLQVPTAIYEEMKNASSKGVYLNKNVKGHYAFIRIR